MLPSHRNLILIVWGVICLLQGYFTELHPDEAYYWVYSQNLDWGQFHQPPMIAVFIKAGYAIFPNELGVRLLTILTNLATIWIILDLVRPKRTFQFAVLVGSLFFIHAASLLAVPDSPLIFFSAWFLWLLRRYLERDSLRVAIMIGLIACAVLYSKYHGIVFLGFCLLPNLKLLRRPSFWLIPIIAIAAYIPHILWQIDHDYATFRFHFFNREFNDWSYWWVLEYLGVQAVLLGPAGFYLLYTGLKLRKRNDFYRTLTFSMVGVFVFFLIFSFRNRIEANWTATAYLPMIILGGYAWNYFKARAWIIRLSGVILLLIMIVRVELATGLFKPDIGMNFKYDYYKEWAMDIKEEAGGHPVVFMDSYQLPSLYWFYTGDKSHSYNTSGHPGNQYDFYSFQKELIGKDVMVIEKFKKDCEDKVTLENGTLCYQIVRDFRVFSPVWLDLSVPDDISPGKEITIKAKVTKRKPNFELKTTKREDEVAEIVVTWMSENVVDYFNPTSIIYHDSLVNKTIDLKVTAPDKPGSYILSAGVHSFSPNPGRNSYFYRVEIER